MVLGKMKLGKMKFIFLMVLSLVFALSFVSAVCTVTLNKEEYNNLEIATATMTCSAVDEKLDAYELNWTNATGYQVHLDTGTTPSQVDTQFFESYTLPSDYSTVHGGALNATLSGGDTEGQDNASVSSAGTNDLIITPGGFSANRYIGLTAGVKFTVTDENNKKITNAQCRVHVNDDDGLPIEISDSVLNSINGECQFKNLLEAKTFEEGTSYLVTISCFCGSNGTSYSCIDEDGLTIVNSIGTVSGVLTIKSWLEVNTLVDKSVYNPNQEIFICVNVTNVEFDSRVPLHIYHQIRCSSGLDNDVDLDRALIISDNDNPDNRGISNGTTQMQCKRFYIPDAPYLQGKTSECYASTNVMVLNDLNEEILGYSTTSPVFNITFNNLQVYAKWERLTQYKWNAIINLSTKAYQDYSGTGIGDIQIHLALPDIYTLDATKQYDWGELPFNNLLLGEQIDSIEAYNSTGEISTNLHFKKLGQLDLILEDVNLSSGWYNVTINLNSFEERQTEALEGIENKTGTFHLEINCDDEGVIEQQIECDITGQIEDPQAVQKEVDFTCYIVTEDGSHFSETNWNKMITKTASIITKSFNIPGSFSEDKQYIVQCHADYYNLGSRRDSFYDTFTAISARTQVEEEPVTPGGTFLDNVAEVVDRTIDVIKNEITSIIEGKNKRWMFYLLLVVGTCYFTFGGRFIKKRKQMEEIIEK